MKKSVLVVSVAGLLATMAFATQWHESMESKPARAPTFEHLDKNVDGAITIYEAKDSWLAYAFHEVDVNQDGLVSRSEYEDITKSEYEETRG